MTTQYNEIVEVTLEQAFEEADRLEDRYDQRTDSTTIIQGKHPEHGQCVIVIPPMGNVVILPLMPMMIRNVTESPLLLPSAG
jgi:hypothetical protein